MYDHCQYDYDCKHKAINETVYCRDVIDKTECTEIRTSYFNAANNSCLKCNYSTPSSS